MYRAAKTPELRAEFSRMTPEEQGARFLELMTNFKSTQKNSQAPEANKRVASSPSPIKVDKSDPFDSYESTLAHMQQGMGGNRR
ncbi:MAG TPA: hypothetical protein VNU45_17840, partial [Rummeliibacillus sp.]|nr:hypothetical protein [Rummeliibacillus sp.]